MKIHVIDASVAVKWFLPDAPDEPHIDHALELMLAGQGGGCLFLQPPHWAAEVAAVLARRTPATASDAVQALLELDFVETAAYAAIYRRAIALAQNLNHHLFDTLYHAAALEHDATLITADERYFAKAAALGSIRLLHDFTA
jgi:predicted nucleic acid-binding protein